MSQENLLTDLKLFIKDFLQVYIRSVHEKGMFY